MVYRLSLLAIFALILLSTDSTLVAGQGWYPYDYNLPCYNYNYPTQPDFQEYIWEMEAYYFLNNYDPYGGPAYSHPQYSTPAYSIPTYRTVPTYTTAPIYTAPTNIAAYSAPSNNAPANNQSMGSASYWLNEANVSYLTGSYEQAAESYAKAVNLDPFLKSGWLNLGNSLLFSGKYQASLNAYNALLSLEPQNAEALAGRSLAMEAIGKNNTSAVA